MVEEDKIQMTATTQEYEAALVNTSDRGTQVLGQLGELRETSERERLRHPNLAMRHQCPVWVLNLSDNWMEIPEIEQAAQDAYNEYPCHYSYLTALGVSEARAVQSVIRYLYPAWEAVPPGSPEKVRNSCKTQRHFNMCASRI